MPKPAGTAPFKPGREIRQGQKAFQGAMLTNALVWHGTSMMYAVKYKRIISLVFSGVLLPVTLI